MSSQPPEERQLTEEEMQEEHQLAEAEARRRKAQETAGGPDMSPLRPALTDEEVARNRKTAGLDREQSDR